MNAKDFITHYTKKIIQESSSSESSHSSEIAASTRVKLNRFSRASKEALALAASNPGELANKLRISRYEDRHSSNPTSSIHHFLTEVMKHEVMNETYGVPTAESKKVIIPLEMISKKDASISPQQAPRFIKASLIAGALLGLVVFDIEDDKVELHNLGNDEEENLFQVHVNIK
jgi:hypothetical protein